MELMVSPVTGPLLFEGLVLFPVVREVRGVVQAESN